MPTTRPSLCALPLILLGGCTSLVRAPAEEGGTSTGPVYTSGLRTTGAAHTSAGGTAGPAGPPDLPGGASAGPDLPPGPKCSDGWCGLDCDPWTQSCAEGSKCMPMSFDGGPYDALRCMPLAPAPRLPGEPCTIEGNITSGVDDCAQGAMCWVVERDTLQGTCVAFCTGSPSDPTCDDPDRVCVEFEYGLLNICLPRCDPLLQDCPEGDGCIPHRGGDDFACVVVVPSEGGAAAAETCVCANGCDPGLTCQKVDGIPGCEGGPGCCAAYCDLADPDADETCANTYPEPGAVCVPYYEPGSAPLGYETVGLCLLPPP